MKGTKGKIELIAEKLDDKSLKTIVLNAPREGLLNLAYEVLKGKVDDLRHHLRSINRIYRELDLSEQNEFKTQYDEKKRELQKFGLFDSVYDEFFEKAVEGKLNFDECRNVWDESQEEGEDEELNRLNEIGEREQRESRRFQELMDDFDKLMQRIKFHTIPN